MIASHRCPRAPRSNRLARVALLAAVVLAPYTALAAPTLCVNPGGTGGCFATLQAAVLAAKPATVIEVAAGTYVENVVLATQARLTIRGAGAGMTVIDGGAAGAVIDIDAERTRLDLAALTLRNGAVPSTVDGAGINTTVNVTLELEDVVVEDNDGHGIRIAKGTLVALRTAIRGNTRKGVHLNHARKVELVDAEVENNGNVGLHVAGGRTTVRETSLSGNGREGMLADLSPATSYQPPVVAIADSVIDGNGHGGVAFNGKNFTRGQLRVERTAFRNNFGTVRGGGLDVDDGRVWVNASTFSGNSATRGGGIFMTGVTVVTRSTISGNSADEGGGIWFNNSVGTVSNTTIADNSATTGGGIYTQAAGPRLAATILGDNQATNAGPDCFGTFGSDSSLIEDASACNVVIVAGANPSGVDPLLGPLQDNGGGTDTHALLPGSPALAQVTAAKLCKAPDQRGVARSAPCDIGAYEAP